MGDHLILMSICSVNSRVTELKWATATCAVLACLFVLLPQTDLAASGLFYQDGHWLLRPDSLWLVLPYHGMPRLGQAIVLALFILLPLSFLRRCQRLHTHRSYLAFLLVAALIGPITLVDVVFKEHSGRARPINVQAFGGEKTFTPAFVVADQCRKNCAFVSGHVAAASFFMAFGWLSAPAVRRRWMLVGLTSAGLVGLARMLPGGHFLSDVVFAWFSVYFTLWGVEWLFRRQGWLSAPPAANR